MARQAIAMNRQCKPRVVLLQLLACCSVVVAVAAQDAQAPAGCTDGVCTAPPDTADAAWQPIATSRLSAPPPETAGKAALVNQLLTVKERSGKRFTEIAQACGLTNVYTANLFFGQAQLHPGNTTECIRQQVPALDERGLVERIQRAPFRTFDKANVQDPLLYRFQEALDQNGLALKSLINELFGDGIMSAIDFFMSVDRVVGVSGEDRVVVTLNGKFLPFAEQLVARNTLCAGQCS